MKQSQGCNLQICTKFSLCGHIIIFLKVLLCKFFITTFVWLLFCFIDDKIYWRRLSISRVRYKMKSAKHGKINDENFCSIFTKHCKHDKKNIHYTESSLLSRLPLHHWLIMKIESFTWVLRFSLNSVDIWLR